MKKKRPRISKKQDEQEMSIEERNLVYRSVFGKCQHQKGYVTNTGIGNPSVCVECGKSWIECVRENRENNRKLKNMRNSDILFFSVIIANFILAWSLFIFDWQNIPWIVIYNIPIILGPFVFCKIFLPNSKLTNWMNKIRKPS